MVISDFRVSNFLAMKLTNKLRTAYWPKMNPGNDQNRRSKASVHNVLIPLDERHLRMWLRELYPSQFSPEADLNAFDNASLELEEIRAVFRALQARLIKPVWFHSTIFNA